MTLTATEPSRPSLATEIDYYRRALHSVFKGRRIILLGGPVSELRWLARSLRELGAERPFIIGSSMGPDEAPPEEEAGWCSLEVSASTMMEVRHAYENLLTQLPDEARAQLDAYDADRKAAALGSIIFGEVPLVGGRPRYGARPKSWMALEDKVAIDAFWDAIDIDRAASEIVHPDTSSAREAAGRLDQGLGTVWAADAREGVNAHAEGLRWVRSAAQAEQAATFFATRCDRIRVMPFLEGIPCSIHGLVAPTGVAAFRPIESLTLQSHGEATLIYAGEASYWDPPPAERERMRDIAHRTGRALSERLGFRGAFSVDGVLTRERGFLPTELNTRIGTGLALLDQSLPELSLTLLALAVQAGEPLDFRVAELERLVVTAADARRYARASVPMARPEPQVRRLALVYTDAGYVLTGRPDVADADLTLGPSEIGGFVSVTPRPGRLPRGSLFAPRAITAFEMAERQFGLHLGRLDVAPGVR